MMDKERERERETERGDGERMVEKAVMCQSLITENKREKGEKSLYHVFVYICLNIHRRVHS